MRMNENELPKKILWTNRGGQRGRGRPKSRWTDGVEEDTRKLRCRNWGVDIQDSGRWRHSLEEAKDLPRVVEPMMIIMMMMTMTMATTFFDTLVSSSDSF